MIPAIPPRVLAAVRAELRRAGFITLSSRFDLAKHAACTVDEIDAAIEFVCKPALDNARLDASTRGPDWADRKAWGLVDDD